MKKTYRVVTGIVAVAIAISAFYWISVSFVNSPGHSIGGTDIDTQLGIPNAGRYTGDLSIEARVVATLPDSGGATELFSLIYVVLWTVLLFFALLVSLTDLLFSRWRSARH